MEWHICHRDMLSKTDRDDRFAVTKASGEMQTLVSRYARMEDSTPGDVRDLVRSLQESMVSEREMTWRGFGQSMFDR